MSESDKGPRGKWGSHSARPPTETQPQGKVSEGLGGSPPATSLCKQAHRPLSGRPMNVLQLPPAPRNPAHGEAPPGDEKGLERKSHETLTGREAQADSF